ncbi:mediator of RNA polymerase II transcription subunit 7 [Girardinichthys multiradiatus]|uniref:mediator of RNA polymerase II transcription subunit 7 n=1 Tax=Girardinichthys multiradiatus TaxID=208333 RepID=UPI001FAC4DDA|nr:mediator of RNA polymerase II transcription subunit 7 [Girardinichthys multiradiatus]
MGEPQQVSALPPPPTQFIKEYTDENIRKGLAPKPPPPIRDSYMMFGNQFQCDDLIIRPLESQGIERLHPMQFDHKQELKKLNMSILVNFLDLLDILIKSPGSIKREEKLEDIKLLFVHMHHLINEYRPHQARETLRVMMEVQKRQRLETAERFQKHLERVVEMIQGCLASLPDDLPQSESPDIVCGGSKSVSVGPSFGCSSGQTPLLKTAPMDVEETGSSCMEAGVTTSKRDKIWDKDAAMCSIIDEIA